LQEMLGRKISATNPARGPSSAAGQEFCHELVIIAKVFLKGLNDRLGAIEAGAPFPQVIVFRFIDRHRRYYNKKPLNRLRG